MTDRSTGSASAGDAIIGDRTFVAVVVAAYFTIIALTPRQSWMPVVSWVQLLPLSALYLALGIWGFDYARRRSRLLVSLAYLLIEFAIVISTLTPTSLDHWPLPHHARTSERVGYDPQLPECFSMQLRVVRPR